MRLNPALFFSLFMVAFFAFLLFTSREWQIQARLFPWAIGFPALVLAITQVGLDLYRSRRPTLVEDMTGLADLPVDRSVPVRTVVRRALNIFGWILGFFLLIWFLGFLVAVPLFVFAFLLIQGRERWWATLAVTAGMVIFTVGLFDRILHLPWPEGLLQRWLEGILG